MSTKMAEVELKTPSGAETGMGSGVSGLNLVHSRWNPDARQYLCCCGFMHVKTGAYVIGILQAIRISITLFALLPALASCNSLTNANLAASIVDAVIEAAILAMLFYGLNKNKANFLLPSLVYQGIMLAVFGILTMVIIAAVAMGTSLLHAFMAENPDLIHQQQKEAAGLAVGLGVLIIVAALLNLGICIWFFVVTLQAYRFLVEKSRQPDELTLTATLPPAFHHPTHMAYPPGYASGGGMGEYGSSPYLPPPPYVPTRP